MGSRIRWDKIYINLDLISLFQVLDLLRCSLVSKTHLTETLMKHKLVVPNVNNAFGYQGRQVESGMKQEIMTNQEWNIYVKLIVSKSRKVVLCSKAKKDFVNLVYSSLTILSGQMVKKMGVVSSRGCIDHLYKSIQDLDEQCFKSNNHKVMLVSPGGCPWF